MNNRQKLPLGGLLSIERAILAILIGNHMSNDKIEGAIACNFELQLKKNQEIHLQPGLAVSVGCIFAPWRNCD